MAAFGRALDSGSVAHDKENVVARGKEHVETPGSGRALVRELYLH